MTGRIRLMPLVIVVASFALTARLGAMWQELNPIATPPASAAPRDSDQAASAESAEAAAAPPSEPAAAGEGGAALPDAAPFDPLKATDAEIQVLEKLAARREILDRRARDLKLRESLLQAAESRLESRIADLRKIKQTIESLLRKHDAEQEAKLRSLVKIYESMKPKDAAQIFEQLELNVVLDVVERMREQRAAPILARMSPAKAEKVTAALAARRALPPLAKSSSESTAN